MLILTLLLGLADTTARPRSALTPLLGLIQVESRTRFTRMNVLHLWEWVEADLVELGVKLVDQSIFSTGGIKHCGTMQLQLALLKIALLLGAEMRFGCPVNKLDTRFNTLLMRLSQTSNAALPCDLLIDATGARCPLFQEMGFSQQTMLRSARALGIVCHFVYGAEAWETRLQEGTWSQQYYQERFTSLQERGVTLQNFVYYRRTGGSGSGVNGSHYCVMTADAGSLLHAGALESQDVADLLSGDNVDMDALEAYARVAVKEFIPQLAGQPMLAGQLQIFDFSERKQSNISTVSLGADRFGGSADERVLVTRVGDALQEPFWPEGLGINRGFLQVLDCADMIKHYLQARRDLREGSGRVTPSTLDEALGGVVMRREFLYGCTKRISGTNRLSELKPPTAKSGGTTTVAYRIDPCTRYCHLPPGVDWDGSMKVLVAEMGDMEKVQAEMAGRLRAAEQAILDNQEVLEQAIVNQERAEALKEANVPAREVVQDKMEGLETAVRQTTMAMRDVEHMIKEPTIDVVKVNKAKARLVTLQAEAKAARDELHAHEASQAALDEEGGIVEKKVAEGRAELLSLKLKLDEAMAEADAPLDAKTRDAWLEKREALEEQLETIQQV